MSDGGRNTFAPPFSFSHHHTRYHYSSRFLFFLPVEFRNQKMGGGGGETGSGRWDGLRNKDPTNRALNLMRHRIADLARHQKCAHIWHFSPDIIYVRCQLRGPLWSVNYPSSPPFPLSLVFIVGKPPRFFFDSPPPPLLAPLFNLPPPWMMMYKWLSKCLRFHLSPPSHLWPSSSDP